MHKSRILQIINLYKRILQHDSANQILELKSVLLYIIYTVTVDEQLSDQEELKSVELQSYGIIHST